MSGKQVCITFFSLFLLLTGNDKAYNSTLEIISVINESPGGSREHLIGWRFPYSGSYIFNWGRSKGFTLIRDRAPVVDGKAFYVSPYGSQIYINKLKRDEFYRLWIDFVTFDGLLNFPHESLLEISVKVRDGTRKVLSTLRFKDLKNSYYYFDLPYEYTVAGEIRIDFIEYGRVTGIWGVWDMVVTKRCRMSGAHTKNKNYMLRHEGKVMMAIDGMSLSGR